MDLETAFVRSVIVCVALGYLRVNPSGRSSNSDNIQFKQKKKKKRSSNTRTVNEPMS
jgi:hypothetical protein